MGSKGIPEVRMKRGLGRLIQGIAIVSALMPAAEAAADRPGTWTLTERENKAVLEYRFEPARSPWVWLVCRRPGVVAVHAAGPPDFGLRDGKILAPSDRVPVRLNSGSATLEGTAYIGLHPDGGESAFEIEAAVNEAVMGEFAKSGDLTISATGRQYAHPPRASAAQSQAFLKRCATKTE